MADNVIIRFTAESDMSKANQDLDILTQKEKDIVTQMDNIKKKQAEFQGAPKVISLLNTEYKKLDDELKKTKSSIDTFSKSQEKVNDTVVKGALAGGRLTTQIRTMKDELSKMEQAGLGGSKAYVKLAVEAGKLEDQIGDTRQRIQILSSDTKNLDAAMGAGAGLAGAFTVATSAAALLGGENEELQKAFFKVQAVMSILNGVNAVAVALNKDQALSVVLGTAVSESNTIAKIKNVVTTRLQNSATIIEAATTKGSTVARIAATASQWALNAAMYAFPIIAIIAALAALTAGIIAWTSNSNDAKKAQEDINAALREQETILGRRKKDLDTELAIAKARGASDAEQLAIRRKYNKEQIDLSEQTAEKIKSTADKTRTWWDKLWNSGVSEDVKKSIADSNKVVQAGYDERDAINLTATENEITAKSEAEQKKLDTAKASNEKYDQYILGISSQLEDAKISIMKDGIDKQIALINLEYERKFAAIKGNSAKEIELRLTLEKEKQNKIAKAQGVGAIELEKLTGDGIVKVFEETQNKKSDILNTATEKGVGVLNGMVEKEKETGQEEIDNLQKKKDKETELLNESVQLASEIGNLLFDSKKERIQQEMADLDQFYTTDAEAAKKNKNLKLITAEELAKKQLDLKIKAAKADKEQALFNIAISTAQAVMATLARTPLPAGLPLMLFTIAAGAAQAIAVASKPLPKYAKGKKAGGDGHFATVGELGAETMWIPNGAAVIPHNRAMNFDTFRDFNIPMDIDSRYINGQSIDYNKLGRAVADNVKIPQSKPITVNVDKDGITSQHGTLTTVHLNKKYLGQWN